MTRPGKPKGNEREPLSAEDAALWRQFARDILPLSKEERRARKANAAEKIKLPKLAPARPKQGPAQRAKAKPAARKKTALDRETSRKLSKGKQAIEARLDLHGMRQAQAHKALARFLRQAQAKNLRNVLVITGRGTGETAESFYAEERGVLREAVPRWLEEPEFAPLVVSFAPAPRRLGGEGALYLRLRKKR